VGRAVKKRTWDGRGRKATRSQHNRTFGFANGSTIGVGFVFQQQLKIQNYHFILNYTDTHLATVKKARTDHLRSIAQVLRFYSSTNTPRYGPHRAICTLHTVHARAICTLHAAHCTYIMHGTLRFTVQPTGGFDALPQLQTVSLAVSASERFLLFNFQKRTTTI